MSYSFKKSEMLILALLTMMLTGYPFSDEKTEFSLISNANEIVQYEPLIINFQLKNIGSTEWEVIGAMDYNAGWIKLEIAKNSDKFYKYDTSTHILVGHEKIILKPNQLLSSQIIMYTYRKPIQLDIIRKREELQNTYFLFPFAEPGTYQMKAIYPLERYIEEYPGARKRKVLTSNILEIKVRAWNKSEKAAFNFFKNLEDLIVASGGCCYSDKLSQSVKEWENFINLYPKSPYAPYVKFNLGRVYYLGTTSIPGEATDYSRAIDFLAKSLVNSPNLLADDELFQLAKVQIELGRFKEAKATVDKLIKEYPLSNNIPNARRIRTGIEQGYVNLDDIFSKVGGSAAIDAK